MNDERCQMRIEDLKDRFTDDGILIVGYRSFVRMLRDGELL